MVTVLPPKPNPGLSIAQGAGEGFLSTFQPAIQQQYQRGQLQQALEGLKGIANDPNATPYDIASSLISSTSQIPGSERYVGQLFDALMRSRQTQNFFNGQGNQGGQGQPQGQPRQQQPQPRQQQKSGGISAQGNQNPLLNRNEPLQQSSQLNQSQGQQQGFEQPTSQGTPPLNIMSDEQMHQEARRQAIALNDPSYEATAYQNLVNRNEEIRKQQEDVVRTQALETKRQEDILTRDNQLRKFVEPKLKTDNSEEINDFMLIGQRYDNLKNNPAAWYDATKRDFNKYMNAKTSLENANIPGIGKGIFRPGQRQSELKRLDPIINNLVKYGKEDYAREKLASLYLSPTEIEERIHPITPQTTQSLEKLPRALYESQEDNFKSPLPLGIGTNAPWDLTNIKSILTGKQEGKGLKSYDELSESNPEILEKSTQKLADFLKNNIKDDSSLLVLRDNLFNKKGYDWRQFSDALNLAEQQGLKINSERQDAERAELTRPPIQSLPNLFNEWGNWVDYLRGNK